MPYAGGTYALSGGRVHTGFDSIVTCLTTDTGLEGWIVIGELAQTEADLADGIGLKISKAGGLTRVRRQREICAAAGLTMSVPDTVGSTLSAAAIFHLGATVPGRLLRCVLDPRDMVTRPLGAFDAPIVEGGVVPPDRPGLGVAVDRAALGAAVAVWAA